MPPEENETLLVVGIVIAVAAIIIFVTLNTRDSNGFQCPNDYQTSGEYVNGTAQWLSEELEKFPHMTKEELLREREKLLYEYNCERSHWMD